MPPSTPATVRNGPCLARGPPALGRRLLRATTKEDRLGSAIRGSLRRIVASALALSFMTFPVPRPAEAVGYLTDTASHPPPISGTYAYYATAGTFGPDQAGFPAVGGT